MRPLLLFLCSWLNLSSCTVVIDTEMLENGVCADGFKPCDDVCRPDNLVEVGCGTESCSPCALPNARQRCGPSGECAIATCVDQFMDCDGNPENGCEADTLFNPTSCGGCDRECEVAGAVPDCANGRCAIRLCNAGRADCNRDAIDGCEVDVQTDSLNCGECGRTCESGVCVRAECSD